MMNWIGSTCVYHDKTSGLDVVTLNCIPLLITNAIYWLLILSGAFSLIFIILSGYRYITSGGDPKQLDQARKTATYAIVGLVLILCSFLIVETIASATGVGCINSFASLGFSACQ